VRVRARLATTADTMNASSRISDSTTYVRLRSTAYERLLRGARVLAAQRVLLLTPASSYPDVPWHRFIPAVLVRMRPTPSASTGFSPYEPAGLSSPAAASAPVGDGGDSDLFDFDSQVADVQRLLEYLATTRRRRATDLEARDARLQEMTKLRRPMVFDVGDWVHVAAPTAHKTAPAVSEPRRICAGSCARPCPR
jgi:hypothetical protein